jgi:hypothetical protein
MPSVYLAIALSLHFVSSGLYALWRAEAIAAKNRALIESGRELYFEQRRAWHAYGTTPPSTADEVRRGGRKALIGGILIPITAVAVRWLGPYMM